MKHNHSYFKDNMACCAVNCAKRPALQIGLKGFEGEGYC